MNEVPAFEQALKKIDDVLWKEAEDGSRDGRLPRDGSQHTHHSGGGHRRSIGGPAPFVGVDRLLLERNNEGPRLYKHDRFLW